MTRGSEGLLLVDKPSGPTSHDIVARVRRALGGFRTGHAGTLDPFATGLLPIVLGRATRLARFLPSEPKAYVGEVLLGVETSTDDATGEVRARFGGALPSRADVSTAAARLVGRSLQVPPLISARHLLGERMYRRARRGESFDPPPKDVDIFRFDVEETPDPAVWSFEAAVSSGTYLRALARDLGAVLGCGGVLKSLRRISIGPLSVTSALAIAPSGPLDPDLLARATIPTVAMPLVPPPCVLDEPAASRFVAGTAVDRPAVHPPTSQVRVLSADGSLLGIGEIVGATLRPRVVVADRAPSASLPGSRPLC